VVPASSRHGASVSFDGRNDLKLERGDRVEIRMSPYPFPTYATDSNSFSKEWFNSIKVIKTQQHWCQSQLFHAIIPTLWRLSLLVGSKFFFLNGADRQN